MRLIDDTLKSPDGKWSRKSLTMLVSFVICVILGGYIVVSDKVLDQEVNQYAIEVFDSFMILVATLSGVTVLDKITGASKKPTSDV